MLAKEDFMVIQALTKRGVYQRDIAETLGVHPKTVQLGLIRFGGHLPKGEYDVDHDGHEGQAAAAELHG